MRAISALHQLRLSGLVQSLDVRLQEVGELKGVKVAGQYSAVTGYGLLIGRNTGTPVSHEYKAPFAFTGKLEKVTVDLK